MPNFSYEKKMWAKDYYVIGIDEVGRGALSGPMVIGAVCFAFREKLRTPASEDKSVTTPYYTIETKIDKLEGEPLVNRMVRKYAFAPFFKSEAKINIVENIGIDDSKRLTAKKREKLAKDIKDLSLVHTTVHISNSVIDRIGLTKSSRIGVKKAISSLLKKCNYLNYANIFVLIDGLDMRYLHNIGLKNQRAIIKGDQKSISIAAASILAKVERDRNMVKLHQKYPIYNWQQNKGYGTKEHLSAIKKFGKSKFHRLLFLRKL